MWPGKCSPGNAVRESERLRRSAIDAQHRAGDVACRFRAEEGAGCGKFLDLAETAGRDRLHRGRADLIERLAEALGVCCIQFLDTIGEDTARQEHVAGDAGARDFRGQRLVPADECAAQRVGKRKVRDRLIDARGCAGKDAAPACAFICGRSALVSAITRSTIGGKKVSSLSAVMSSAVPGVGPPVLLTRMSMPPSFSLTAASMLSTNSLPKDRPRPSRPCLCPVH